MNRVAFFIIFSLGFLLSACSKKEFKLEFELPESLHANYTVIYYASDKRGGVNVETVAAISHGKASLACMAVNPTLLYLFTNPDYPIVIYAEKGDKITISGTKPNPATWSVDGNDINRQLSAWRNGNADILASNDPKKINGAVEKYVLKNPSSEISPILLLTYFSRYADDEAFRRLWGKLDGEARSPKWPQMIGRADIPTGAAAAPARMRSIAMRTLGNGLDTLKISKAKASLFLFWNNGIDKRKEVFDSIKSLARAFPDSASRLIVDVCMDADSLSWRSPLRSDSLKKVVRAWAPAGMADETLMKLGVTVSPLYLVISPDGRQRYHGQDRAEAFREFRKIMAEKPKPTKTEKPDKASKADKGSKADKSDKSDQSGKPGKSKSPEKPKTSPK